MLILISCTIGCVGKPGTPKSKQRIDCKNIKGITYTGYGSAAYSESSNESYFKKIHQSGSNHASVLLTCMVTSATDHNIVCDSYDSPKWSRVASVLESAKGQGLGTSLRIYIDISGGKWRVYWRPDQIEKGLKRLREVYIRFAKLAQAQDVDLIILGAEIEQLTRPDYTVWWRETISEIRKVFSGKLTYGANGNPSPIFKGESEYEWVGFWDNLDFVGIDHYPSFAPSFLGSESENSDEAILLELRRLHEKWLSNYISSAKQKPLLLTEVGFPLAAKGIEQPYKWNFDKEVQQSERLQALNAKALLQAIRGKSEGALVWRFLEDEKKLHPMGYILSEPLLGAIKNHQTCTQE
ncbi:MAG: hypothetical protein HRT45_00350 [Bdellovibrionales bacterium]|nr:hypothetical protein [Bdellovibrionales bacterium]